jgi:hypothetical protein
VPQKKADSESRVTVSWLNLSLYSREASLYWLKRVPEGSLLFRDLLQSYPLLESTVRAKATC